MKRLLVHSSCIFLGLLGLASTALAQPEAQFAKANQEFGSGLFREAVNDYEGLVRSGAWNANLFYNLGNAYFRTGNFGRAILNYERALVLEPHHPEAQANLGIARDEARALELPQTSAERYLRSVTGNRYAIAATVAFWLGAFSLASLFLARRRSAGRITLSICSLIVFALLVAAAYWLETGNRGRSLAIVTGDKVEARVATADNANSVLALPPGSEVNILSQRGEWLYATLPNNLRGWIPAKNVEPVKL